MDMVWRADRVRLAKQAFDGILCRGCCGRTIALQAPANAAWSVDLGRGGDRHADLSAESFVADPSSLSHDRASTQCASERAQRLAQCIAVHPAADCYSESSGLSHLA